MNPVRPSTLKNLRDPKSIYLFYRSGLALVFSLVFTAASLYHIKLVHMNPLQLVLVGTMLEITHFLCEIPTGIVADRYSRKLSILIGLGLVGLGLILEGAIPTFFTVLLAQIIWGVGDTFTSGADTAWIVDELAYENGALEDEEALEPLFLRSAQLSQWASLFGIPLSLGLAMIHPNIPFFLSGVICLAMLLLLFRSMPEKGFSPQISSFEGSPSLSKLVSQFTESFVKGGRFLRMVPILMIAGAVMFFEGLYSEGFDRLWTAHFLNGLHQSTFGANLSTLGFDSSAFSFLGNGDELSLLGVNLIAAILGILLMKWLEHRAETLKDRSLIGVMALISGGKMLFILLFATTGNVLGIAFAYCLGNSLRNSFYPLYDGWVNRQISQSELRATTLSLLGQLNSIGQILGGPILGFVAWKLSLPLGLVISGILAGPILFLFWKLYVRTGSG